MPINSKKKGAAAERAFAHFLKDNFGLEARRGVQYQGSKDSPDIVCPSLGFCHFEVKAVERLNVYEAMGQAEEDAEDLIPVVAHKRNRSEWFITIKAKDLREFSSKFLKAVTPQDER